MKLFKKTFTTLLFVAAFVMMLGAAVAEEYTAYFNIQGDKFTFRNSWDDADYGIEGSKMPEGIDYFSGLIGWENGTDAFVVDGKLRDTTINGNGTYAVGITGLAWNGDSDINRLYVSTNVPCTKIANDPYVTYIGVYFDGALLREYKVDDEDNAQGAGRGSMGVYNNESTTGGYLCYDMINAYNSNIEFADFDTMPTDILVVFTLAGMENDLPEEENFDVEKYFAGEYDEPDEGDDVVEDPEPTEEPEPTEAPEPTEEVAPTEAPEEVVEATATPTKTVQKNENVVRPTAASDANLKAASTEEGGQMNYMTLIIIISIVAVVIIGVVIVVFVITGRR